MPVEQPATEVRSYWLYGEVLDDRVEIAPSATPDLRVVLVHVDGVEVAAGDRVIAGRTMLARGPRRLPFASQIDRETDPDRWPHVHLEVQPVPPPSPDDG